MLSSIIAQLQSNPVAFLASMLIQAPAILIALTCHEVAHGYIAKRCGDPTAEMLGRLSFNPLHHLDPVGTICMFLFGFGWAKAVPINPRNFKNYRRDDLLVSIAGIVANLLLFLLTTLLMVGLNQIIFTPDFLSYYGSKQFLSVNSPFYWMLYSGSTSYLVDLGVVRVPFLLYVQRFLMVFSWLNLGLAVFNLFPIPPLDGYHVVNDIVLKGKIQLSPQAHYICMFVLLGICFSTNIISNIMSAITSFVQNGVVSFFLLIFGLS